MFFTQEDYRKIEKWLLARTAKDSEFPHADPLKGNEDVPIIQDGKNKTLTINELVEQVAMMELPDFFNVTTFAKKGNLFLEDAINCVPVEQRKLGLTITFHSAKGHWLIYQFKGTSLNQWSSLNYWRSPIEEALEELVVYPDEEDITGVRDGNRTFLKFKDKDYDPADFSGMGRITLRKNLVGTEACSIDDEDHMLNILKQDMIREENTVYIIQYDFDLDGKVISIPKGCTLWFQGGSVNNGTLYLHDTAILGAFEFADMGDVKLFGKFNLGQVMTFSDDSYKVKGEGYFKANTKPSSATIQEDTKNDREIFYDENPEAYTTKTRQELRWWNGVEWCLILDKIDYNELKSIIDDLIDKHNAEMSACYKYFKSRCYSLEQRMDNAENKINELEAPLEDLESRITNIEGDITNINNSLSELTGNIINIQDAIANLNYTINNLDQIIENHVQSFIETHILGATSVTVNGNKCVIDSNGNITIPDYPEPGGGTADRVKGTLTFTGASTGTYNGSTNVTINIPEGGGSTTITAKELLTIKQGNSTLGTYDGTSPKTIIIPEPQIGGGTADKVAYKLRFTGAVNAEYDGSSEVIVNIPTSSGGSTTFDPRSLILQDQKSNTVLTYNATVDKAIRVGSVLFRDNYGDTLHDALDGNQTLVDLRGYANGGSARPVVLYAAEITRAANTTNWGEVVSTKHEGIGSVSFVTDKNLLKVNINPKSGWSIQRMYATANARDLDVMAYNSNKSDTYNSNGGWIQCATNGSSTIFLHAWRTGNKNNDTVYADGLQTAGCCLGLSIIAVGYITKS